MDKLHETMDKGARKSIQDEISDTKEECGGTMAAHHKLSRGDICGLPEPKKGKEAANIGGRSKIRIEGKETTLSIKAEEEEKRDREDEEMQRQWQARRNS